MLDLWSFYISVEFGDNKESVRQCWLKYDWDFAKRKRNFHAFEKETSGNWLWGENWMLRAVKTWWTWPVRINVRSLFFLSSPSIISLNTSPTPHVSLECLSPRPIFFFTWILKSLPCCVQFRQNESFLQKAVQENENMRGVNEIVKCKDIIYSNHPKPIIWHSLRWSTYISWPKD